MRVVQATRWEQGAPRWRAYAPARTRCPCQPQTRSRRSLDATTRAPGGGSLKRASSGGGRCVGGGSPGNSHAHPPSSNTKALRHQKSPHARGGFTIHPSYLSVDAGSPHPCSGVPKRHPRAEIAGHNRAVGFAHHCTLMMVPNGAVACVDCVTQNTGARGAREGNSPHMSVQ